MAERQLHRSLLVINVISIFGCQHALTLTTARPLDAATPEPMACRPPVLRPPWPQERTIDSTRWALENWWKLEKCHRFGEKLLLKTVVPFLSTDLFQLAWGTWQLEPMTYPIWFCLKKTTPKSHVDRECSGYFGGYTPFSKTMIQVKRHSTWIYIYHIQFNITTTSCAPPQRPQVSPSLEYVRSLKAPSP